MSLAADLDLATDRDVTDLRQYTRQIAPIFGDLKFLPFINEVATIVVGIPSGLEKELLLATILSLYQVDIQ